MLENLSLAKPSNQLPSRQIIIIHQLMYSSRWQTYLALVCRLCPGTFLLLRFTRKGQSWAPTSRINGTNREINGFPPNAAIPFIIAELPKMNFSFILQPFTVPTVEPNTITWSPTAGHSFNHPAQPEPTPTSPFYSLNSNWKGNFLEITSSFFVVSVGL